MPIRKLPPLLVNQIAAGEVIERPANVVKELLENAVDAGAGRIDVAIEDGGRQSIRVCDDGAGMAPDDLALAFEPHATSKLAGVDDLFAVGTLGFRGEALASIGSVSHARIVSRAAGSDNAFEVTCRAGEASPVRPCAGPPGTTVEVSNLFFNTPARRKFLKSDPTEFGHIAEQVLRVALPYPRIRFTLTHNGKRVHDLPAGEDARLRIRELLGAEAADALIPVDDRRGGAHLTGWIAPPRESRANDKWQYLFLNGRYVRDRTLQAAVREAYRGLLEVHRRPVVFLFLVIDPAEVDVNVHPTKIEVRFRNGNSVYRQTLGAVREALLGSELAPELRLPEPAAMPEFAEPAAVGAAAMPASSPGDAMAAAHTERVRAAMADFFRSLDPAVSRVSLLPHPRRDPPGHPDRAAAPPWSYRPPVPAPMPEPSLPAFGDRVDGVNGNAHIGNGNGYNGHGHNESGINGRGSAEATAELEAVPADGLSLSNPAGASVRVRAVQLHNAFLVAETPDGMIVVDQHALHERILYEKLKGRVENGGLTGQRLLLPERVSLSARQSGALGECRELLGKMGIEVDDFGNGTAAVQSFPTILRRAEPAKFLAELLDGLADRDGRATPEMLLHAVIDMAACKAAVKAGDPLTPEEIDSLLAAREAVDQHHTCAHGRPTTLKLTIRELERQFKRH